jgi:hypothetical protein
LSEKAKGLKISWFPGLLSQSVLLWDIFINSFEITMEGVKARYTNIIPNYNFLIN